LVARSSASAPPIANRLVEAKNAVPYLQRSHDLHVDHARLAVEHAADPGLAKHVHARRQAVAAIGGMLERHGIDQPFDRKEPDRDDVDEIGAHVASPVLEALPDGRLNVSCRPWQDDGRK
jgi:hypothetical protein